MVFDGVLCSRPGDGRLDDEDVSGLATGMVSFQLELSFQSAWIRAHAHAPTLALLPGWWAWQRSYYFIPRGQTGLGETGQDEPFLFSATEGLIITNK